MTNKDFNAYVFEQRRQGCSDSQIARSLGMSLAHFIGRLNGVDVDKVDPPKSKNNPDKKEKAASLIADMAFGGAKKDELGKAVAYSKDVIDSDKKPVNLKKSKKENDIDELSKRYQKEDPKTEDNSWMD